MIKTYVDVGIGIIAKMAYNPERDGNLMRIERPGLFDANTTRLALRRGIYLCSYAHEFIPKQLSGLTEEKIGETMRNEAAARQDFVI